MRFEETLTEAILLRRNRFNADVKLDNGDELTVYCAHPGSMQSCNEPGSKVLLSSLDNPKLKFKHQIEIIYAGKTPVAVHTGRPANVVAEAIGQGSIPEVAGYATLRRDPKLLRDKRVDLVLEGNGLRPCYVQVKNVTFNYNNTAYYPDANMTSELENLAQLTDLVRGGNRALIFFVAQRADVSLFRLADHVDAEYTQAFRDTVARGVEVLCHRARVSRKSIELEQKLPVELVPETPIKNSHR